MGCDNMPNNCCCKADLCKSPSFVGEGAEGAAGWRLLGVRFWYLGRLTMERATALRAYFGLVPSCGYEEAP